MQRKELCVPVLHLQEQHISDYQKGRRGGGGEGIQYVAISIIMHGL